ncbi:Ku protein [Streptomyces sp. NPDC002688]|uniref:Ku protein n=1 Tax=Streptomyces sp. NPDC002688 TaxID=3154423 RepID=UPI003326FB32
MLTASSATSASSKASTDDRGCVGDEHEADCGDHPGSSARRTVANSVRPVASAVMSSPATVPGGSAARRHGRRLERSSKVAVAKYAWSGRERLGLLRVRDNVIVLHAMRWADEIRDPSQLKPEEVELTEGEIAQAEQLIDRLTRDDLEGDDFTDRYTEAVGELIDAKREHREPPTAEEPETPGQVVDLMAALKESVAKVKASRGEDATVHDMPRKKTAAKKRRQRKRRRQRNSPPRRQPRRRHLGSRSAAPEPAQHPAASGLALAGV